eukprot:gnl/TRDRNA2_/TRDRNA2_201294_c0_seq1.p1 gnl/TRDRNA2_/TRDRNA2_201294_c0~~gnl/TRDRNA2_/TRDRNA2_201294_c0_seq1.p1  ORF type:complete len:311 (+),score=39.90 gnl/TRDRNA2_/TRDRNA2_201294_c0_seq1:170-1102(+)
MTRRNNVAILAFAILAFVILASAFADALEKFGDKSSGVTTKMLAFSFGLDGWLFTMNTETKVIGINEAARGSFAKCARSGVEYEPFAPVDTAEHVQRHGLAIGYSEGCTQQCPHVLPSWKSKEHFIGTPLVSCNFPVCLSLWPLVLCSDVSTRDDMFSQDSCQALHATRAIVNVAPPDGHTVIHISDSLQPGQQVKKALNSARDLHWSWLEPSPASNKKTDEMNALSRIHRKAWTVERHGRQDGFKGPEVVRLQHVSDAVAVTTAIAGTIDETISMVSKLPFFVASIVLASIKIPLALLIGFSVGITLKP